MGLGHRALGSRCRRLGSWGLGRVLGGLGWAGLLECLHHCRHHHMGLLLLIVLGQNGVGTVNLQARTASMPAQPACQHKKKTTASTKLQADVDEACTDDMRLLKLVSMKRRSTLVGSYAQKRCCSPFPCTDCQLPCLCHRGREIQTALLLENRASAGQKGSQRCLFQSADLLSSLSHGARS
jgi:hypothetical protein